MLAAVDATLLFSGVVALVFTMLVVGVLGLAGWAMYRATPVREATFSTRRRDVERELEESLDSGEIEFDEFVTKRDALRHAHH